MTGVIATIPKLAFSANGAPMANGTVTTYLAGTTTLATTWQDRAQTSANTNPIVLDSRGEATIWLDGTKTYKFVLKDSSGATQWTTDNISGVTSFAQGNPVNVAYAATVTVDASLSNIFYIGTLTGPTTLAITNPTDGQTINIRFLQDATGGRSVTLPGSASVTGSVITTANYVDWLVLTYVASASRWEGCWANATTTFTATGLAVASAASPAAARASLLVGTDYAKGQGSATRTTTGGFVTYSAAYGSGFNTGTGMYTVPTTGTYLVRAAVRVVAGATAGQLVAWGINTSNVAAINGGGGTVLVVPSASLSGVNLLQEVTTFLVVNAGDTINATVTTNASALTTSLDSIDIIRVS